MICSTKVSSGGSGIARITLVAMVANAPARTGAVTFSLGSSGTPSEAARIVDDMKTAVRKYCERTFGVRVDVVRLVGDLSD